MMFGALTGYVVELLTLFCIVFFHELGHYLAAKFFQWKVSEVKLLPFGGVMEVEHGNYKAAKEEIIVSIAGPLQHVWMAIMAFALHYFNIWADDWTDYVYQAILTIGLFNLLPIYPLDGGKIGQAIWGKFVPYYYVQKYSAYCSIIFSSAIVALSLTPIVFFGQKIQLNVVVVALFLLMTNIQRLKHLPFLFFRFAMHRSNFSQRMHPIVVRPSDAIISALRMMFVERSHLFVVIDDEKVEGVVMERQLVDHFTQGGNGQNPIHIFLLE